ncbi:MAG TPA: trypsin-like peptidase domain-containing protein [Acidimicrobiales bacterium]|nr:trypsin-like peptidase domain-containing protein [Acidimicrobiales bacterium]
MSDHPTWTVDDNGEVRGAGPYQRDETTDPHGVPPVPGDATPGWHPVPASGGHWGPGGGAPHGGAPYGGAGGGWSGGSVPPGGTWPPPGGWYAPEPEQAPRRPRRLPAAAAIAALVLAAGAGAGVAEAFAGHGNQAAQSLPDPQHIPAEANASSLNVAAIAAKVDPSVVDITAQLADQSGTAAGTGMVLTSGGIVLTNNHVVEGASSITAQIDGTGRTYQVTVLGVDPTADVALVQLQGASGLPAVSLGDSSQLKVGDPVVAIGNALALPGKPTVTSGSVTALDRSITAASDSGAAAENLTGLLQIDAPIEPGNSGGPLVDGAGQVVGMNTAAATGANGPSTRSSNVGFAIPVNTAVTIAKQIESGQASSTVLIGQQGIMGVEVSDVSAAGAGQGRSGGRYGSFFGGGSGGLGGGYTPPVSSGALVQGVQSGSPAESAGLAAGDVITGVNGTTVANANDLSGALANDRPGTKVSVRYVDPSGSTHTVSVTLEAGPIK